MSPSTRPARVAAALLFALAAIPAARGGASPQSEGLEEALVETVPRPGVIHRSLLSRRPGGHESWLVVSFPGHPGILRLAEKDGVIHYALAGNFLVRARRHLVSERIALATLDCPSDQFADCGDAYRDSDDHLRDVRLQIAELKKRLPAGIRVALLGTSYGTVSSELLAMKLDGEVDAAVHTASITNPSWKYARPLLDIDLGQARARQLFVHHRNDPCKLTPFRPLKKYDGAIPILAVAGAEGERGPECQPFTAHGFIGRERPVMNAIGQWLLDGTLPAAID